MWKPKNIKATNLMAFKELDYNFNCGNSTLVFGKNETDDGADSNGSCKSTILEAIGISITGNNIRLDTSMKDLVRRGEKSMTTSILLENDLIGRTLKVVREIFSNTKSGTILIYVDDKKVEDITSVKEGNEFIINQIGISKEDILNYYLISKERYVSFNRMSDTKKKQVISRFSNSDMISPIEDELDSNIKSIVAKIDDLSNQSIKIEAKIETYQENLSEFSLEELEEKRKIKIKGLEEKIIEIKGDIVKEEGFLSDKEETLKSQNATLEEYIDSTSPEELKLEIKDIDKSTLKLKDSILDLEEDLEESNLILLKDKDESVKLKRDSISNLKDDKAEVNLELKQAQLMLSDIEKGLMSSVECPNCSHEFSPSNKKLNISKAKVKKYKIEEIVKELELESADIDKSISNVDRDIMETESKFRLSLRENKAELEAKVSPINEEISGNKIEIDRLNKLIEKTHKDIDRMKSSIKSTSREINIHKSLITEYKEDIVTVTDQIKRIQEKVVEDKTLEYKDKISEEKRLLLEKNKEVVHADSELYFAKMEKDVYVQFKAHLSRKSISAIEFHSNNFLEQAKSNLRVQMDGYKQTRSGDIREKITTQVLRDNVLEGGMGMFSSGEKSKIDVANILSMKHMIDSTCETGGLDLLVLDEITNSLDSSGTMGVLNMLNSTKGTSMLITHSTFEHAYPHAITVIKELGISTIK